MRIFAGQAIQADILCDGRLILGVGRGAFAYEMARMEAPIEESRARSFDKSLDVLIALFTREEVSWDGKYYKFAAAHGDAAAGDQADAAIDDGGPYPGRRSMPR